MFAKWVRAVALVTAVALSPPITVNAAVYDVSNAVTTNGSTVTGSLDVGSDGTLSSWAFTVFNTSNVAISQFSSPGFGESQPEQPSGSVANWGFTFANGAPNNDVLVFYVITPTAFVWTDQVSFDLVFPSQYAGGAGDLFVSGQLIQESLAVPVPAVGSGLPGLVLSGGLLAWWRRKRKGAALSAGL